jgi:hypothetical protein
VLIVANNTAAVAFSLVAMVVGYAVLAGLFYGMVYKPRKREKAEQRTREEEN